MTDFKQFLSLSYDVNKAQFVLVFTSKVWEVLILFENSPLQSFIVQVNDLPVEHLAGKSNCALCEKLVVLLYSCADYHFPHLAKNKGGL